MIYRALGSSSFLQFLPRSGNCLLIITINKGLNPHTCACSSFLNHVFIMFILYGKKGT